MKRILVFAMLASVILSSCGKAALWEGYNIQNVEAAKLATPKDSGIRWNDGTVKINKISALFVRFGTPITAEGVEISCKTDVSFRVVLSLENEQVAKFTIPSRNIPGELDIQSIMFGSNNETETFDTVVIIPVEGDGNYTVGHVKPIRRFADLQILKRIDADWSSLSIPKDVGTPWNKAGNIVIAEGSYVYASFDSLQTADKIEFSLDNNDTYDIVLLAGGEPFASYFVPINPTKSGLNIYTVELTSEDAARMYDAIAIIPTSGDGKYSIGHILLK